MEIQEKNQRCDFNTCSSRTSCPPFRRLRGESSSQNESYTFTSRNAPEARYTNQHCRPLHQYRRAKGDKEGAEVARETAMYDLVSRMLDYDPTFRITLKEALR